MKVRNWRHQALIAGGVLLSGVFLWLALRKVDWQELGSAFVSIHYLPVLGCAAALSLSIVLRAVRWRLIVGSPVSAHRHFLRATNLGILTNMLFPLRAGEIIRVVTYARSSHSSFSRPLASAFIDRMVDVFVLIASASVLLWILPIGTLLGKGFVIILVSAGILTIFAFIYARSTGWGEALIGRLAKRWLRRWSVKPEVFFDELHSELRHLFGRWPTVELLAVAVLVLCADYVAIAGLFLSFHLTLPFDAPLLLWVFLAAGSALPSAPGYVGVYQVASIWALAVFDVPASTSVAIATVFQIVTLGVSLIMAGPGAIDTVKRMLLVKDSV